MAGVPINPRAVAEALSKRRTPEWERGNILPIETNRGSGEMRPAIPNALESIISALTAPGNALQGQYQSQLTKGRVDPYSSLIPQAFNMASNLTGGSSIVPKPAGALNMGLGHIKRPSLPFSDSLARPPNPTEAQMAQFGRVERVPVSAARRVQSRMYWDDFEKGKHPGPLLDGYADKPVAVRKENGEYLIVDGNHRTSKALENGVDAMDMYVIDAKTYAPDLAGRKPAPHSMSDDEILAALFGK